MIGAVLVILTVALMVGTGNTPINVPFGWVIYNVVVSSAGSLPCAWRLTVMVNWSPP